MKLAATAGTSADGFYPRESAQVREEAVMSDEAPEPPGNHTGAAV